MLPKINGEIDTETISDSIVTHILLESIGKHYNSRLPHDEKVELEAYVKEKLDDIIKEATNQ